MATGRDRMVKRLAPSSYPHLLHTRLLAFKRAHRSHLTRVSRFWTLLEFVLARSAFPFFARLQPSLRSSHGVDQWYPVQFLTISLQHQSSSPSQTLSCDSSRLTSILSNSTDAHCEPTACWAPGSAHWQDRMHQLPGFFLSCTVQLTLCWHRQWMRSYHLIQCILGRWNFLESA